MGYYSVLPSVFAREGFNSVQHYLNLKLVSLTVFVCARRATIAPLSVQIKKKQKCHSDLKT